MNLKSYVGSDGKTYQYDADAVSENDARLNTGVGQQAAAADALKPPPKKMKTQYDEGAAVDLLRRLSERGESLRDRRGGYVLYHIKDALKAAGDDPQYLKDRGLLIQKGENVDSYLSRLEAYGRSKSSFWDHPMYGQADVAAMKYAIEHDDTGQFKNLLDNVSGNEVEDVDTNAAEKDAWSKSSTKLSAFIDRMLGDLDPNDPEVRRVVNDTRGAAEMEARNRGLGTGQGGLSEMGTTQAVMQAREGLRGQHNALGLQAQSLLDNRELGAAKLDLQREQLTEAARQGDIAARNQAAQQAAQQAQSSGSTIGSIIGGGLGALGSLASFGTLAPILIPAGASLGAGIGGAASGGGGYTSYTPQRQYGYGGLGSGLGKRGYGNY